MVAEEGTLDTVLGVHRVRAEGRHKQVDREEGHCIQAGQEEDHHMQVERSLGSGEEAHKRLDSAAAEWVLGMGLELALEQHGSKGVALTIGLFS